MCMSCADGVDLAYITLYDAPYYSLIVAAIGKGEDCLRVVFEHSLAVDMELEQTRRFCVDKIVTEGGIFSDFNPDFKASQDDNVMADHVTFN